MTEHDTNTAGSLRQLLRPFLPQAKFAENIGVTQQTISLWLKAGKVPPNKVGLVSLKTGLPKHTLNPDFAAGDVGVEQNA
ncbi:MAG: hypothetical protein CVV11_19965 [Gammaproteobacteria bacterium HGW-Gammaproteobacteria-15]|nr:MAG: hypothetical protein CVV11_19965 [Gammaproteobacteria bacterium HGW-Gammaproteobacteria-15]